MIVPYLVLIISFFFVASVVLGLQLFALLSKRLTQRAIQDTPSGWSTLVATTTIKEHIGGSSLCVCVC